MAEVEDRIVISKRKGDGEDGGQEKRLRVETQAALAIVEKQNIARSSTLLAPTMLLTGHQAAVYTLKFDPTGLHLASAGADRAIFLWDTRGECTNYNVLRGHKNVRGFGKHVLYPTRRTAEHDSSCGLLDYCCCQCCRPSSLDADSQCLLHSRLPMREEQQAYSICASTSCLVYNST